MTLLLLYGRSVGLQHRRFFDTFSMRAFKSWLNVTVWKLMTFLATHKLYQTGNRSLSMCNQRCFQIWLYQIWVEITSRNVIYFDFYYIHHNLCKITQILMPLAKMQLKKQFLSFRAGQPRVNAYMPTVRRPLDRWRKATI